MKERIAQCICTTHIINWNSLLVAEVAIACKCWLCVICHTFSVASINTKWFRRTAKTQVHFKCFQMFKRNTSPAFRQQSYHMKFFFGGNSLIYIFKSETKWTMRMRSIIWFNFKIEWEFYLLFLWINVQCYLFISLNFMLFNFVFWLDVLCFT